MFDRAIGGAVRVAVAIAAMAAAVGAAVATAAVAAGWATAAVVAARRPPEGAVAADPPPRVAVAADPPPQVAAAANPPSGTAQPAVSERIGPAEFSQWSRPHRKEDLGNDLGGFASLRPSVEATPISKEECLAYLAKVNDLYQQNGEASPFPEYVFVGAQSSGKSTLHERFLGFKMNITKGGTGTRRPLQATLVTGTNGRECKVQNESATEQKVWEEVMRENKRLAGAGQFEKKPLQVSVKSKDVFSMILTDLPGIKGAEEHGDRTKNGEDMRDTIKGMIKHCAEQPHVCFVICLEADEFTKNPIIEFMDQAMGTTRETRRSWLDRSMFVMNKFDKIVKNEGYSTPESCKELLANYEREGIKPYFVYTKPNPELESESSHAEAHKRWDEWMQKHQEEEFKLMQEYLKILCVDPELTKDIESRMTFATFARALEKRFLGEVASKLPSVRRRLEVRYNELHREITFTRQSLQNANSEEVKNCTESLFRWLAQRVAQFTDRPEQEDMKRVPGCRCSFMQEEASMCDGFVDHFQFNEFDEREVDAFKDLFEGFDRISAGRKYQLEEKLFGGQQYLRQKNMFLDQLVNRIPDSQRFASGEIKSLFGALHNNVSSADRHSPILSIVTYIMNDLTHPALNRHIKLQGKLFWMMYNVAKELAKSEWTVRRSMVVVGRFPTVMSLIDDLMLAALGSALSRGAHNCHLAVRPLYSVLEPSRMATPPGRLSNSMPSDQETDEIRLEAIRYVEKLVKDDLRPTLSDSLDTFVLLDLRKELTSTTVRDAFDKLHDDSYYCELGSFDAAVKHAVEKDANNQDLERKCQEKEEEAKRVRKTLEVVMSLQFAWHVN